MTWDWLPEAILVLLGGGGGGVLIWAVRRMRHWLLVTREERSEERDVDAAERLSVAAVRQAEAASEQLATERQYWQGRVVRLEERVTVLEQEVVAERSRRLAVEAELAAVRASIELSARIAASRSS